MPNPFSPKFCPQFNSNVNYYFGQNIGANVVLNFIACEQSITIAFRSPDSIQYRQTGDREDAKEITDRNRTV